MEDPLLPLAYSLENAGTLIWSVLPISQGTCAFCSSCLADTDSLMASRHLGWWLGYLGASISGRLCSCLVCLLLSSGLPASWCVWFPCFFLYWFLLPFWGPPFSTQVGPPGRACWTCL